MPEDDINNNIDSIEDIVSYINTTRRAITSGITRVGIHSIPARFFFLRSALEYHLLQEGIKGISGVVTHLIDIHHNGRVVLKVQVYPEGIGFIQ